ncbi:MAG: aromatic ring-hydroxylating dioxygenase subunit alpha, partial [Pseudobdellovibrionaceae bacterium]
DIDAVTKQQDGLKWDPSLMLIKDADTQAKWYFALKKEWAESQKENRPFQHPVPETVLKWRS